MKIALVLLAPTARHNTLTNPVLTREERTHYAKLTAPDWRDHPVLLDHDESQPIGAVTRMHELEHLIGTSWTTWHVAEVQLARDAPEWIKKGTPASISTRPFSETSEPWTPNRIIWNALLLEVSLLSAGVRPREPHARVLHLREEHDVDLQPKLLVRNCGTVLDVR
jgi:hypothetical protein